jgi:hypothetical protein
MNYLLRLRASSSAALQGEPEVKSLSSRKFAGESLGLALSEALCVGMSVKGIPLRALSNMSDCKRQL